MKCWYIFCKKDKLQPKLKQTMRMFLTILMALSLFSISLNAQFLTNPTKDNTLVVEGVAILKEIPKDIFVLITVKSKSEDYSECQDMLLKRMEIVKSSILKQNISKDLLKMTEISINENKEYIDGRQEKIGFFGTITLTIETLFSPEFANKLLTALKIELVEYNIKFKLSEDQKTKLRHDAIVLAVEDAKEKAILLANSSNIKLDKINSISYLDDGYVFNQDRDIVREEILPAQEVFMMVEGPGNSTSIDFNPKEIGIYKSVQIEWKIDEK